MAEQPHYGARWDGTITVESRLKDDPRYEEPAAESRVGSFEGRPIIARDTPINGGVYLGAGPREAIVVDDTRYTPEYNKAYLSLLDSIYRIARERPESSVQEKVLVPTFETVVDTLPYDDAVANIAAGMQDKKVNLGLFIRSGGGVCRHQALLAGYLLERLLADRELMEEDRVSIDRNYIPGEGGHAWVRYAASDGTPYILDPAQSVVGEFEVLHSWGWDYRRPGEAGA